MKAATSANTILIVDHDTKNLDRLKHCLQEYTVATATAGDECLSIALNMKPDLILLDTTTPEINGYEVCRILRGHPELLRTKIVILSAHSMLSDRLAAYDAGADDYITKPFDGRELTAKVRIYLRLKSAGELTQSEARYQSLFEDCPISLWEEDYSGVKILIDKLRASGVTDFRAYFEANPDEVRNCATKVKVLDVNKTTLELLKAREKNELLGNLTEIFRSESYDVFREQLIALASGRDSVQTEVVNKNLVGEELNVIIRMSLNPSHANDWSRVIISLTDITDRKKSEEKVREQAILLEISRDAIFVMDIEHRVMYWNRAAASLYGYTVDEMINRDLRDTLSPSSAKRSEKIRDIVLQNGQWNGELQHTAKNGDRFTLNSRWTLMYDENRKPRSILVVSTDVTETKAIEKQLIRSQRIAGIGTLAGGIAHDLNNVLSPILLSTQVLKMEQSTPKSQKVIDMIERSARHGAELVRQILTFARGGEDEWQPVNVEQVVGAVVRLVQDSFPPNIKVKAEFPKNLWHVTGDSTQLHQVILNLCVNARDAMPDGGRITITAGNVKVDESYQSMFPSLNKGRYVLITISDTGKGMPADIVDKIFEPFFTTKKPDEGTGLGLATSMRIVKSHEGVISVKSSVGRGSTFSIYLRAESKHARTPTAMFADGIVMKNRDAGILVVDDEISICEMLNETLQYYGFTVFTATNGAEAVAMFANHAKSISLVITDLLMPVMDGRATISALRSLRPDIRIIGISGAEFGLAGDADAMKEMHAYLEKPFTADKLLSTIDQVLSGVRS